MPRRQRNYDLEPPFVVTGTGRSGTHWCAELLRRAGLRVGHEMQLAYSRPAKDWHLNVDGEVGWPAAAYFDLLQDGTRIAHLVRDPLAVLGSRVGNDKLAPEFSPPVVREFVSATLGEIPVFASSTDRALWFVTSWDRLVMTAPEHGLQYRRFRVEDLSNPDMLEQFVGFVNPRLAKQRDSLVAISTSLGPRYGSLGSHVSLSWDAVPPGDRADYLLQMAWRDGYELTQHDPCQSSSEL